MDCVRVVCRVFSLCLVCAPQTIIPTLEVDTIAIFVFFYILIICYFYIVFILNIYKTYMIFV